ncbi:MAG: hypothetical protein VKN72_21775 [Nostocales cyanobacterium 94392]|nr:hypothetical protein [Nostocales cyanobacterium 94392]
MLKSVQVLQSPTVKHLLQLWAKRYQPSLSALPLPDNASAYILLTETSAFEGRAATVNKLDNQLLAVKCQMAGIQTKALYSGNFVDLNEARQVTSLTISLYKKLLEIYLENATEKILSVNEIYNNSGEYTTIPQGWGIENIQELANELEELLFIFQESHMASKDWRTLGFMTTLINFSNQLILATNITHSEKVLLEPYFKFLEEQVGIPWQRVCAAGIKHSSYSPSYKMVEQMLPKAQEIAETVYGRLVEMFPNHRSCRGGLNDSGVKHSCIRDLNMFQAYLWLCLLEENLVAIEEELVDLCVMVMESVGVKSYMTQKWSQVLIEEIFSHLSIEQMALLSPYTQGLQTAFFKKRSRLGCG